jgi:hypothetical protein
MANRIRVGSVVVYRLFNAREQKFYGDEQEGEVTLIISPKSYSTAQEKQYKVRVTGGIIETSITLTRQEIRKVLS